MPGDHRSRPFGKAGAKMCEGGEGKKGGPLLPGALTNV